MAAIQSNELVAVWNAEVLPSHVLLLHGIIVELVPELVDMVGTLLVDQPNALYVATLAVLAEVDVSQADLWINIEALIVLLSCIDGAYVWTRDIVCEMKPNAIQVGRST